MRQYKYTITKNKEAVFIKIASDSMELNLVLTVTEAQNIIAQITNASWQNRNSIKAGVCLGAHVFWCYNEDKSISLLISRDDDETWEIAILLDTEILSELKTQFKS